jgi:hypothetical protein
MYVNFLLWINNNKYIPKIILLTLPVAFYALIHNILAYRYYGWTTFTFMGAAYSMRLSFGVMLVYVTLLAAWALVCVHFLLPKRFRVARICALCMAIGVIAVVWMHFYVINLPPFVGMIPIVPADYYPVVTRNASIIAVFSSLAFLGMIKGGPWLFIGGFSAVRDTYGRRNEPLPWERD